MGLFCLQVPLPIVHALGLHPFRVSCGCAALQRWASSRIPVLACGPIKSSLGALHMDGSLESRSDLLVVPTTCDWIAKLPALAKVRTPIHVMELPHRKETERGRARWIEEIIELQGALERLAGTRLRTRELRRSMAVYAAAAQTWLALIEKRRAAAIAAPWFGILANAFMLDDVESWTGRIGQLLGRLSRGREGDGHRPTVFLAGSPICFPSTKIPELIEDAGLFVAADDLCASERLWPGLPVARDGTLPALLEALADASHLACACPTFLNSAERARYILHTMRRHGIRGLIYHVLKGCHPYDMDAFATEHAVREEKLHFLRIETDYSPEDRKSVLTRLEAFRETLV